MRDLLNYCYCTPRGNDYIAFRFYCLALLIVVTLTACQKHSGLQIGDTIPSVTLTDLYGKTVNLPTDVKGKVVLIRFWGLECGFCDKQVLFSLQTFYQKYQAQGFIPIAINEGVLDSKDERVKKLQQLTYPLLIDEYGLVGKKFGVIGLPTTLVIDKAGVLQKKIIGEAKIEEFEQLFTTVLQQGVSYENTH